MKNKNVKFQIHGINIEINTNSQEILAHFRKEFSFFLVNDFSDANIEANILLTNSVPSIMLSNKELKYEGINKKIYWTMDNIVVTTPGSLVKFNIKQLNLQAVGTDLTHLIENSKLIIESQLYGLLQKKGIYRLHAAALAKKGKGLLIIAPRGGGKTTTSLSLLAKGFDILSDDSPFWDIKTKQVLYYPISMRVDEDTVNSFSELEYLKYQDPITFSNGEVNWLFDYNTI